MRNRRIDRRFTISLELDLMLLSGKDSVRVGRGHTCNLSNKGVLFTANADVPVGARVELHIAWPVHSQDVYLNLVLLGTVIRSDNSGIAARVARHEFRPKALPAEREISRSKTATEVA